MLNLTCSTPYLKLLHNEAHTASFLEDQVERIIQPITARNANVPLELLYILVCYVNLQYANSKFVDEKRTSTRHSILGSAFVSEVFWSLSAVGFAWRPCFTGERGM